jgi:C1A family cysteine protease
MTNKLLIAVLVFLFAILASIWVLAFVDFNSVDARENQAEEIKESQVQNETIEESQEVAEETQIQTEATKEETQESEAKESQPEKETQVETEETKEEVQVEWVEMSLSVFSDPVLVKPEIRDGFVVGLKVQVKEGVAIISPADCWHFRSGENELEGVVFLKDEEAGQNQDPMLKVLFIKNGAKYYSQHGEFPSGNQVVKMLIDSEVSIRVRNAVVKESSAESWYKEALEVCGITE